MSTTTNEQTMDTSSPSKNSDIKEDEENVDTVTQEATNETDGSTTADAASTPVAATAHKASTPRTKEALRVFKLKGGLCEVETCEQKSVQKTDGNDDDGDEDNDEEKQQHLCQNHLDNGIEAPPEPAKRGRKRKTSAADLPEGDDDEDEDETRKKATRDNDANATEEAEASAPATPMAEDPVSCTPVPTTPGNSATIPGSEPRSSSRIKSCLVDECEKLRAKSGYCLRHFKDRKAPIRSGPAEYERRICLIEGCERLRSKGDHCHRHHKDPNAPIRNKSDGPADRKKRCSIENCDRLQVKGGFCSRHFRNRSAPVLTTPAFSFDADARWDELFPQLQAFYKKNGHSRVPTSQKTDLARFVVHIRCVYRTKKQKMLKADQIAAAQAIATPVKQASVEQQEDVSCEPVPTNAALHPDLTKSKLLTPERMEALKTVNFEFQLWTVEPSQWEQRFQELLAYSRENGNFHVTNKQNATLSR